MPAIPIPFITLSLLLLLLLKICWQREPGYPFKAAMVAGCAGLMLLCSLRWQLESPLLRQLQAVAALVLPPLIWYCFAQMTAHSRGQKWGLLLLIPAAVLILNQCIPAVTDFALAAFYIGYGIVLIHAASRGGARFIFIRLSEINATARMALLAGGVLCFSGSLDLALALNFQFFQGRQAAQLVALAQALLLPAICLSILHVEKPASAQNIPVAEVKADSDVDIDLDAISLRVEDYIIRHQLYLDPALTLDLLARKTGIPARQISQSVNQRHSCNISRWINGFRIQHAQQLLRSSDLPVTEIMLSSGFATKSNFNREFTRSSGLSPTEYRRAAGEVQTISGESD